MIAPLEKVIEKIKIRKEARMYEREGRLFGAIEHYIQAGEYAKAAKLAIKEGNQVIREAFELGEYEPERNYAIGLKAIKEMLFYQVKPSGFYEKPVGLEMVESIEKAIFSKDRRMIKHDGMRMQLQEVAKAAYAYHMAMFCSYGKAYAKLNKQWDSKSQFKRIRAFTYCPPYIQAAMDHAKVAKAIKDHFQLDTKALAGIVNDKKYVVSEKVE